MLSPVTQFRTSNGLFVQGKYRPAIMAVLNIAISILMAKWMGIAGIFWGTVISRALTQLWYDPWLIYRKVFDVSVWEYGKMYAIYGVITVACCFATSWLLNIIVPQEGFLKLVVGAFLCIIIPNAVIIVLFHKNKNYKAMVNTIKRVLKRL